MTVQLLLKLDLQLSDLLLDFGGLEWSGGWAHGDGALDASLGGLVHLLGDLGVGESQGCGLDGGGGGGNWLLGEQSDLGGLDGLDSLGQLDLLLLSLELTDGLQLLDGGLEGDLNLHLGNLLKLNGLLTLLLLLALELLAMVLLLLLTNLLLTLLNLRLQFYHCWCLMLWHLGNGVVNHRVQSLLQLQLNFVHLLLLLLGLLLGLVGDLDDGLLGLLLQLLGSGHGSLGGNLLVLWGNSHDLLDQLHLLLGDLEHLLSLLLLFLNSHLLLLLTLDLLLQLLDQSLDLHAGLLLDELSLLTLLWLLLLTLLGNGDQLLQLQLHLLHFLLLLGGMLQLSLSCWHAGGLLVFGLLGHDLGLDLHDGGLHLGDWHLTDSGGNQSRGLLSLLSLLLLLLLLSDHVVQLLLQFLLHGEHLLLHLDMLDLNLLLLALELLLDQEGDLLLLLGNLGLELGGVQGAQVLLSEELLLLALLLLGLLGILSHELLDQSEQLLLQSQLLLLHLLLAHDGLSDLLLLLLLGLGGNWGSAQRVLHGQLLLGLHDLDQLLLLLLGQLLLALLLLLLSDLLDGKVLHVQVSGDLHLLLLGLDDLLGDLLQLSNGQLLLLLLTLLQQGGGDRGLGGQLGLDQLDGSLLLNGLVHLLALLAEEVGGLLLLTLLLLGHLESNLGLQLLELSLQLGDLLLQLLLLALLLLVLLLLTGLGLGLLVGGQLLGTETLLQLGNELLDGQLVVGHWLLLLLLSLLAVLLGNAGSGLDRGHDVLGDLNGGESVGGLLDLSLKLLAGLGDHEALGHALDLRVVLNIDKLVHWRLSLVFACWALDLFGGEVYLHEFLGLLSPDVVLLDALLGNALAQASPADWEEHDLVSNLWLASLESDVAVHVLLGRVHIANGLEFSNLLLLLLLLSVHFWLVFK